jgi:hypothetical protein
LTKFREKKRNRLDVPRIAPTNPDPADAAFITYHVCGRGGVQRREFSHAQVSARARARTHTRTHARTEGGKASERDQFENTLVIARRFAKRGNGILGAGAGGGDAQPRENIRIVYHVNSTGKM